MASSEAVVSEPAMLHEKPLKILNTTVHVAEHSKREVTNRQIQLFGRALRSRSRSGSASPFKGWWGKDVWTKAELYLTETTLCYSIEDTGVIIHFNMHPII